MNDYLVKILKRYELDKPILMRDKLDIIWDKRKEVMKVAPTQNLTAEEEYERKLRETTMTEREGIE